MPHNDFELTKAEFMALVKDCGYPGTLDTFRELFARVPFHWPCIYDNFVNGQILWTISDGYEGKRRFGYWGSNPEDHEWQNKKYRNGLLAHQIRHYEYHMTYGYYAKRDFETVDAFVAAHPEYNLHYILSTFTTEATHTRLTQRRAYGTLLEVREDYLFETEAWVIQKDDYFSGSYNGDKDNYTAVPVFHPNDVPQIIKYLKLKEGDNPINAVYWEPGAGIFAYDYSASTRAKRFTNRGFNKALHPRDSNFTVIPTFWAHAWKIQVPHVREDGEIVY